MNKFDMDDEPDDNRGSSGGGPDGQVKEGGDSAGDTGQALLVVEGYQGGEMPVRGER